MILGLSGKTKAGKDTTADYLIENRGWDRKVAFSDNLKKMVQSVFGLTTYHTSTQEGKNSPIKNLTFSVDKHLQQIVEWVNMTHDVSLDDADFSKLNGRVLVSPRDILQFVGTDVVRMYCPNYHYEQLFFGISDSEKVIISDTRFPNEASAILEHKGILVRISRNPKTTEISQYVAAHPSEVALDTWDRWDYSLYNNGVNIERFFEEIDIMVETLEI